MISREHYIKPIRDFYESDLIKIITGKYAEEVLLKYKKVIFEIIPELKPCDGFDQKSKYHVYDVYTHAYGNLLMHLGIFISVMIACVRLDGFFGLIKKKNYISIC